MDKQQILDRQQILVRKQPDIQYVRDMQAEYETLPNDEQRAAFLIIEGLKSQLGEDIRTEINIQEAVRDQTAAQIARGRGIIADQGVGAPDANVSASVPDVDVTPEVAKVRGSRLPMMDDVRLIRILRRAGFRRDRDNGHAVFKHADGRQVPVPIHGELAVGTRDSIFNMADIPDPTIYM